MNTTLRKRVESLINEDNDISRDTPIASYSSFPLAGNIHPVTLENKVSRLPNEYGTKAPRLDRIHGTTTLGFIFQGGVIICVDSRSTMGPEVGSQTVKKFIEITDDIIGTMAGGAADCQFWERNLARQIRLEELKRSTKMSVASAAHLLSNTLYQYKGMGLSVGTMVAGYDKTGPNLFYVDNDGGFYKGNLFSVGSGSTYAYGVLDNRYREDLSEEEAIDLAFKAIYRATHRDAMSGGYINCLVITEQGMRRLPTKDCYEFYWNQKEAGVGDE